MFEEDLDVFFNKDEFAVQAILNDSIQITGILDDNFEEALGMAASGPRFTCPSEAIDGARTNDRLTVRTRVGATDYRVVGIEPDGKGVSVVRLAKE